MMNRNALGVWRWGEAISPGMMTCRPAYRLFVMKVVPRRFGFSRTSTRRSASRSVMRAVAFISSGRSSAYVQIFGTQGEPGFIPERRSHSGDTLSLLTSLENFARSDSWTDGNDISSPLYSAQHIRQMKESDNRLDRLSEYR